MRTQKGYTTSEMLTVLAFLGTVAVVIGVVVAAVHFHLGMLICLALGIVIGIGIGDLLTWLSR